MLLIFQCNKKNHMICILILLQVKSSTPDYEKNLSYSDYIGFEGFQTQIETYENEKTFFNSSNLQRFSSSYPVSCFYNSNDYHNQQNSSLVSNSSNSLYDHSDTSNSIQNYKDTMKNICFNNQVSNIFFDQIKFDSQPEINQYMEIKENDSLELSNQGALDKNTNLLGLKTLQNTDLNYQEYQKDFYQNSQENNYQNISCLANNNKFLYSQNSEGFYSSDYQNGFEIKSCDYQDNRRNIQNVMNYNFNETNQPNKKRKIEIIPKEANKEKLSNAGAVEKGQFIEQKQTSNYFDNVVASDKYLICPITSDQNNAVLFQENKEEMPESNPYYNKLVPFLKELNQNPNLENNHSMNARCKKDTRNKYNERCLKNKLKKVKLTDIQSNLFQKEKDIDTTYLDDLTSNSLNNMDLNNEKILKKTITIEENLRKLDFNIKKYNQNKNFKLNHKNESSKNILNKYKNEIINMNKEIQKSLDLEKNKENTICIINKIIEFLKYNNSQKNFRFSFIQSKVIEINYFELEEAINFIRTDDILNYFLPEFEFFSNECFQTFSRNQNIIHTTIFNTWILFFKNLKHYLKTALDEKIEISIEILKYIVRCFTFIAIEFLFDHDFRTLQYKFLDTKLILKLKFDQNTKKYFFDFNNHMRKSGYFSKYSQHLRFIFLLRKRQFYSKEDSIPSIFLNSEKNKYLKKFLDNIEVKSSDFYYFKSKIVVSTIFYNLSKHRNSCLPYFKVILFYFFKIKFKNIYADFLAEIVNVEEEIYAFLQYYRLENNSSDNFRVDENKESVEEHENKKYLCIDKKIRQLFLRKKFQKIIYKINILLLKFEKKEKWYIQLNLKNN